MDFPEQRGVFGVRADEDACAGCRHEGELLIEIGLILPGGDHGGDLGTDPLHGAEGGSCGGKDCSGGAEAFTEAPEPDRTHLREHVEHDGCLGIGHGDRGERAR